MEHRRVAWAACVVAVTTLGFSGLIAQGCSDDDNSTMPTGTGGGGGSGGGATGGKAGTGGSKAGNAGSAGAKVDSGVSDAPTEAQILCSSTLDSGSGCVDSCLCANCASEALVCLSEPRCRALVDCAGAMGCGAGSPGDQVTCARTKCGAEFDAGFSFIAAASALGTCLGTAMCIQKCTPDGGGADAPTSDVRTDSPAADAPAADAPATDAPAADSPTTDSPPPDSPTTDAPATASPTTDAPAADAPATEAAAEAAAEAGGD